MKNIFKIITVVFLFLTIVACSPEVEVKTYTVSFNTNGGIPSEIDEQIRNEGSKVRKPSDPTKEETVFLFWFNEQLDREWYFDTDLVDSNIILIAKYEDISEQYYNVTFNYDIEDQPNEVISVLENDPVNKPDEIVKKAINLLVGI